MYRLLILALALAEWFTFHGSDCHDSEGNYLDQMGVGTFFSGYFVNSSSYHYSSAGDGRYLYNCVDSQTVTIIRAILFLSLSCILLTLVQFVLDLVGPKQRHLMLIRRNGLLNVIAVLLMVTICGMCYWASKLLVGYLHNHKRAKGSKIHVDFGMSYYILVGATVSNILASALNLLRKYPPRERESEQTRPILSDADLLASEVPAPPAVRLREPPPYAP